MPRTASEVQRLAEAQGIKWTPELRAYAIANGAIDDSAPSNANLAPNLFSALMSVPNAALSGATMDLTDKTNPSYDVSTGAPWLDTAINKVITPTARGLGMSLPLMLAPQVAVPKALAEGGLLARAAGRALAGAPGFSLYEGGAGAVAGARENGVPGAIEGFNRGATRGATVGAAMGALKVPERLGGAYTGAGLGLGALTAAEGGGLTDIAGSVAAGYGMHAIGTEARTTPRLKTALRSLDHAEAVRAEKTKILNDLLSEQYAEQQANEAALELQSRKFEDLVPAKGEVQKRREYERTRGRGSLPEIASEARLELVDAPEDARTNPNEGPKIPLFQGMGDLVTETPAMARERIRLERLQTILDADARKRAEFPEMYRVPRARQNPKASEAARLADEAALVAAYDQTPAPMPAEQAAALAPSLVIPGLRRPGSVIDPTARGEAGGPIEVVPGGSGEPVGAPVLRRPGQTRDPAYPLNMAEEYGRGVVDEELRTYKGDRFPLNPPPNAPIEKPGFLRTAEDRIPPDSQDARSEPPPPEAPVVPTAPETPAPPEQGAPVEKPKRRPGKKKPPDGDITLNAMIPTAEQIGKVFRRPGSRKPAAEKRPGVKKDNILAAAFLPAEVQIARQSPEARKVAEMLHAGKYDPKQSGGRYARALVEYRASSMTPDESVSIGQAIQGFKDPDTLTPKARKLMDVTRRYLKEIALKSGGVDMKLYTVGGKRVDFPGPNESFFPHITVKTEDLKVGGKARERVIKNSVAIRAFGTEAEAAEMLDSYVDIAESGMHARNKKMAERLMERGKADTVEEAVNLIKGNRRNTGPERFGSLEYAREFDNPFYEPDFNKAMTQYSREAERRISETKNWGQDNERLKEAIAQIHGDSERKSVELTANTAKGIVQSHGTSIDDAAIVMRRFGSYMMSPLSAIRNTGQVDNSLLLTDFRSVMKAINLSRESRLRAIESGTTSGPVLRDVEMGKGGAPSYQKLIGQTGTEVLLRTHANNAGMNYFHDYVDRIRKNPNDKFAQRELRKMGQDPADLATGRELTRTDYNKAGFNIAARGQFMYDELDVPAWFNSTQPGKTASQFKPWIVQQSHLIYDETVGQWRGGTREGKFRACRNVALLATLYPLRGEVLNDVISLIQGKKRESNLYKRYLEDAAQMGVLTVCSDLYNAVRYDNAEGLMMGASASKLKDMANIAGAIAKNGKLSYSQQRLVFRMVPIIGPLFAYRLFPQKDKASGGDGGVPAKKIPGKKVPGKKRPGTKVAPRN